MNPKNTFKKKKRKKEREKKRKRQSIQLVRQVYFQIMSQNH